MTSANLDLVRSIYADWGRGDYTATAWANPEIEWVMVDGPNPGSWTGLAGMAEGFRSILSVWEDWRTVVDEYRELDEERVLVLLHMRGRGKTSGLDVGQLRKVGANLWHIRGGKVARFVIYFDRERAFADLGLPSEAESSHS